MKAYPHAIALAALLLCIGISAGCSSTARSVGNKVSAEPQIDIERGSPTEDLIAAMGQPQRIEPDPRDPENLQVWIYIRERSQVDMRSMESVEVPYVNPITGEMKMILEPVYKPHTSTTTETLRIYVVNDQVLGWKVDHKQENTIEP